MNEPILNEIPLLLMNEMLDFRSEEIGDSKLSLTLYIYNKIFVNSERSSAKSCHVDIALTRKISRRFFVKVIQCSLCYIIKNVKIFFLIGIQLYKYEWKIIIQNFSRKSGILTFYFFIAILNSILKHFSNRLK